MESQAIKARTAHDASPARTLLVAAAVALVCSLLVSSAVYLLRPIQSAYATLEQNRVILMAAGLTDASAELSDREIVRQLLRFDTRVVDLEEGWFARGIDPVDVENMAGAKMMSPIPDPEDIAGIGDRPRYVPVYLLRDGDRLDRIVLPVYGEGMWSTIHGYVCLESDLNTIAGVEFHRHGETPGIGDRIQNAAWRTKWRGKRLYDAEGRLRFRIANEGSSEQHRVDAISGASVTVGGVDNTVQFWFGQHGFGPFLARLREES